MSNQFIEVKSEGNNQTIPKNNIYLIVSKKEKTEITFNNDTKLLIDEPYSSFIGRLGTDTIK